MTKLKIKENIKTSKVVGENYDASDLVAGDMLYSYDTDSTVLVIKCGVDKYGNDLFSLVDLNNGLLVTENEGESFEEIVERHSEQWGPFYLVSKAKITFTVGE